MSETKCTCEYEDECECECRDTASGLPFPLNEDQKKAVRKLHEFVAGRELFFTLLGHAGTGKSTTINTFVSEYSGNCALTAPTNKATKVLRCMAEEWGCDNVEVRTIYSLLGLRLKGDKEKQYIQQEGETFLGNLNVVVVDEASMVSEELLTHIRAGALEYGVKFIFMGDPCQLPPVGEVASPVMDLGTGAKLEKVERHDNQILTVATEIRNAMLENRQPVIQPGNDENGGVWTGDGKKFAAQIEKAFLSGTHTDDTSAVRVIAWRNSTVESYNNLIRKLLYGDEASQPFHLGERVMTCKPVSNVRDFAAGQPKMGTLFTDDEGTVRQITVEQHPIFKDLKCLVLQLEMDDRPYWEEVFVIHPDSAADLDRKLSNAADNAKARKGSWSAFWDMKEVFHDIRPCHAITAHRSQGSTYEIALVDAVDIRVNRNFREMMQCLYVAVSRPSRILVMRTR